MPDELDVTHARRFGAYIIFVKITGARASIRRVGIGRHAGDHAAHSRKRPSRSLSPFRCSRHFLVEIAKRR